MIQLCCRVCAKDIAKITMAIEAEREKAKGLVECLENLSMVNCDVEPVELALEKYREEDRFLFRANIKYWVKK